jgi:hypothetical protein
MSRFGPKPRSELERFMAKVRVLKNGCWLWIGRLRKGYGRLRVNNPRRMVGAYRWAFEHFRGPIPEGFEPDHVCRLRACVNPFHLEIVTRAVNVLRGESPVAKNARKTHCKRGHAFRADNIYYDRDGHRQCKACCRLRNALQYRKHRQKRLAQAAMSYQRRRENRRASSLLSP